MFKNYLKIALRNLIKYKIYSAINIVGLSIGIACCILLFLFVLNEHSYDSFHANKDNLYRVYVSRSLSDGQTRLSPFVPMPFGPALESEFPEVKATIRFQKWTAVVGSGNNLLREQVIFTDPAFFEAFSFPLLAGNPNQALLSGNAIVLSEEMAQKYFSDQDPLGESISIRINEGELDFLVTGVAQNAPENSSLKFDFLVPFERLSDLSSGAKQRATSWRSHNTNVYVLLNQQSRKAELEDKLPSFESKYFDSPRQIHIQNITDVHLSPAIGGGWMEPVSDPKYSYILGGIAIIVLIIACINFMTLSVGQSASRSREVGMRKVMGAQRFQLMKQFWGEALIMSLLALFLGMIFAELFLPTFNNLIEKNLDLSLVSDGHSILALVCLVFLVGLIAGGYPALLISKFQPIQIFRKKINISSSANFGRIMVIFQFSLSIFLIITTIIMGKQKHYLLTKNLGYDQDQVLVIPTIRAADGERFLRVLQDELSAESRVVKVSGAALSFDRGNHNVHFDYQGQDMNSYEYRVDYDYLSLLGLQLLQGRDFSREHLSDPDHAAIVNEAFVKRIGGQNPLGKAFTFRGRNLVVIGVVKDYHFQSLHNAIEPVVLHLDPDTAIRYLLVRLKADDIPEGIEMLKSKWQSLAAGLPFEYYFLDSDVARQYRAEERWDKIVTYSSMIALFIACLGLFGLSALSASRRTREIGIRKVLGATVPRLLGVISREHLFLVILGNVVAWPIAYLTVNQWLQNFAYRIQPGIGSFLLAATAALVIALLTVSYQGIKAALANPVDSLRCE